MLKLLAAFMLITSASAFAQTYCPLTEVKLFTENPDPSEREWMKADGRILSTKSFDKLYSLLQNRFGGDEVSFNLPLINSVTVNGNKADYYICVWGMQSSRGGDYETTSISLMASKYFYDPSVNYFPAEDMRVIPLTSNIDSLIRLIGDRFVEGRTLVLPGISMGVEVMNGPGLFTFFVASGIYPNPDLYDSKCIKGEVVFNFLADGKIPLNLKEVTVSNKITLNIANSTVRPDQYPRAFECQ